MWLKKSITGSTKDLAPDAAEGPMQSCEFPISTPRPGKEIPVEFEARRRTFCGQFDGDGTVGCSRRCPGNFSLLVGGRQARIMTEQQSSFVPAAGSGEEKAFWKLARNAEGGDPVAMQQLGLWLLRLSASENQLPPGVGKEGFRWISRALSKSEKLNSKTMPRSGAPGQRTSRFDH